MKELIQKKLNSLIGLPLWNMGRSGSTTWFDFGSHLTNIKTKRGEETLVGEYVLDTESDWHIVGPKGTIIVGSQDRSYPTGEDPYKNLMEFEWDKQGENRCDERMKAFIDEHQNAPLAVESVVANDWGGLAIHLSNDCLLEIFTSSSLDVEYWRLFEPAKNNKHFVVTAHGIE